MSTDDLRDLAIANARDEFAPRYTVQCRACNGTGLSPHNDGQHCDQCDGLGKVVSTFPEPQSLRA